MKKLIAMATVYLSLLALVVHTAFAQQPLSFPSEEFGLGTGEGQVTPGNIQAICFAGFYIDEEGHGVGAWDTTLYVANITDAPILVDVQIWITGAAQETSHQVAPRELLQLSCDQLRACDTRGFIIVESSSVFVSSVMFIHKINLGPFTAIPLTCFPP